MKHGQVQLRVEALLPSLGLVMARIIDESDFWLSEHSTLEGRLVKHFDVPRRLDEHGALDFECFGLLLRDPQEIAGLAIGQTVTFDSEPVG